MGDDGDDVDTLLEWLRDHGGEGENRFHKQCRVWRDAGGGKRMTQPAMQKELAKIIGVGVDKKGKVVPKEQWQVKKVRAAIRTSGTDGWEEMDVAERRQKFVNLNSEGVPYNTTNSAFTLKMLNGERDPAYPGSVPQKSAWEDDFEKDLLCSEDKEHGVELYLKHYPRAANGSPQIIAVDYDDPDETKIPQIWWEQLPWTMSRGGYHFYMHVVDMPADSLPSNMNMLVFKGEVYGKKDGSNIYEMELGWTKGEDGQRFQGDDLPLKNWDEEMFTAGWKFDEILKPFVSGNFYGAPRRSVSPAPSRGRSTGSVSAVDVPEFSKELLQGRSDFHTGANTKLYEMVMLIPNNVSYDAGADASWLLVGQVLHHAAKGHTSTCHLPLWILWSDGGPADEDERKRLLLEGPPVARGAATGQQHFC